jgi:hypothetical protein
VDVIPKIFAKIIRGIKNFRENENWERNFAKVSEFSLIFAFRLNEKRGFRFNPKLQYVGRESCKGPHHQQIEELDFRVNFLNF